MTRSHTRTASCHPSFLRAGVAAGLLAAAFTAPVHALGTAPGSTDSAASASSGQMIAAADKKFLLKAAAGGLFEVEAGKLAAGKATDPAVKSYGQMLVTDHTAANEKLMALASAHGVTVPATLPSHEQKMLDKLSAKSGTDFDKAFIKEVGVKDHKKDVSLFEHASKKAKADDVRQFAASTLPTLQQHLAHAEAMEK